MPDQTLGDPETLFIEDLGFVYPPPYYHLIWNYEKANVDCIRKSLNSVDWGFALFGKNVHKQSQYLNTILMNVFSNYILNKWVTIDDKEPPWINDEIRNKFIPYIGIPRNTFYQQFKKYKINLTDLDVVDELTLELSTVTFRRKNQHYFYLAKT